MPIARAAAEKAASANTATEACRLPRSDEDSRRAQERERARAGRRRACCTIHIARKRRSAGSLRCTAAAKGVVPIIPIA